MVSMFWNVMLDPQQGVKELLLQLLGSRVPDGSAPGDHLCATEEAELCVSDRMKSEIRSEGSSQRGEACCSSFLLTSCRTNRFTCCHQSEEEPESD